MSTHPINLFIRLLLEVVAIITFGIWGYTQSDSWTRILLAILFPVAFAVLWGIFAVRDDPSRSGKTVVQTPGIIRLFLELGLFGSATWMLFDLNYSLPGWIFGTVIVLHYIVSYDRILWLLKQPDNSN